MGPRLPRTAQPQRAQPSATTTAWTSASGSSTSTSTPVSPASTRRTCAAGCAGTASTPSARQGIPGGRTAVLEPEELEDEYFMLRIRIDGGALTSEQLRVDRRASRATYGRDVADITDRQNVQLHWIRIEDVPAIWERSKPSACPPPRRAATPRGSCSAARWRASPPTRSSTPAPRCARRSSATSATRRSPTCRASSRRPISGCARHCTNHEINDVAFVGVIGHRRRGRLRPVGRRRAVDQPDVRPAARRVRRAGRGQRGVGRRHVGVPRLRLPPLAQPRAAEVPASPTGARRGSARSWRRSTSAGRCPTARSRPRRRRCATTSASSGRATAATPSAPPPPVGRTSRHRAGRASPSSPTGSATAGCAPPPSRDWSCWTSPERDVEPSRRRARRARAGRCGRRRSSAARWPAPGSSSASSPSSRPSGRADSIRRRAGAAAARLRHPDHDQRQRLPELLRPLPGRRHRLQGHRRPRAGRRGRRGVPGAPRRPARRRGGVRAQVPRPEGHRGRGGRLRRAGAARLRRAPRATASRFAAYVTRADEAWLHMSVRAGSSGRGRMTERAAPFYCPYCGEEDLRPFGETARRVALRRLPAGRSGWATAG